MNACTYYSHLDTPLGTMIVTGDGRFVTGLYMPQHKRRSCRDAAWQQSNAPFAAVSAQLADYFAGKRQTFDIPIKLAGTPFQLSVWQELVKIPFATTISYAELAKRLGRPTASRAVGHANARNPVSILVPCHRVIGANGQLTGYAGGVATKRWLLDLERGAHVVPRCCGGPSAHWTMGGRTTVTNN